MVSAEEGKLVTFGVVPHTPETGYGYIRRGESLGAVQRIAQFVEKPDLDARAVVHRLRRSLLEQRHVRVPRAPLSRGTREVRAGDREACRDAFDAAQADLDFTRVDAKHFESCPSDSIDYAVMEKTGRCRGRAARRRMERRRLVGLAACRERR